MDTVLVRMDAASRFGGALKSNSSGLAAPAWGKNSAAASRNRVSTVCCAGFTDEILPIFRQMFWAVWKIV